MRHRWVDYRAVKADVSMEMVLATYGIQLHRLDHVYLRGRCPLPTHQSKTSLQSFIVNIEKNAWACHSESCVARRAGGLAAMCSISLPGWSAVRFATRPLGCTNGSR